MVTIPQKICSYMLIKRHYILILTAVIFLFVTCALTTGRRAFCQEVKASDLSSKIKAGVHVDKNEVTIGDKFSFVIRVEHQEGITLKFPEIGRELGIFAVKNEDRIKEFEKEEDDYLITERSYVLCTYEAGRQTIPPLTILYDDGDGDTGKITTDEIAIDVKGVIGEKENPTDIKDIAPPVAIKTNFIRLFKWVSMGIAVVLVGIALFIVFRRWKKMRKAPEEKVIKRLPHEIAYELLKQLSSENLIEKGLIKEYYYRITNILRHYIEDQFGLSAPERTTEEFLMEMAYTEALNDNQKRLIQKFLEKCDMVKYAKYSPSVLEIKDTYNITKQLIDETKIMSQLKEEKEVAAQTK